MKILFTGDFNFGRNYKICNYDSIKFLIPFFDVVDVLVFNLETVLVDKSFDVKKYELLNKDIHIFCNTENNIANIRKYFKKSIFVSTINNHTFDYGLEGYYKTLQILDKYNYKFTVNKDYYMDDNFIFVNATDHWTILESNVRNFPENTNLWNKNCILINSYDNELYSYKLVKYLNKIKNKRKIIFSIHWGKNYYNNNNEKTYLLHKYDIYFKKLCDLGVDILVGHGAHHIFLNKPYEIYNNKLIIYGLGDCISDFKIDKKNLNTNNSMMLIYNTSTNLVEEFLLGGIFNNYINYDALKCKHPYIISS